MKTAYVMLRWTDGARSMFDLKQRCRKLRELELEPELDGVSFVRVDQIDPTDGYEVILLIEANAGELLEKAWGDIIHERGIYQTRIIRVVGEPVLSTA